MTLEAGRKIGPYEVEALVGAGGMGEVYRARDTKLGRAVALKVLPESFAADPERRARFEREARTLATLNHPNIAAIHGFEDSAGISALVLEFVDGPTLADRIVRGPVPLDEALPIARQIADALEAAHEQGIVHRDLKPANIKVRDDGTVKVLDFGLARLIDPSSSSSTDVSASPTITSPAMTAAGVILGTAAYMSPEQARGKPVDRRGDIWAFGLVFYEMLTGRRAFEGDDVSITLAGILKDQVDWTALPGETPAPLRRLLRRCLEKNPRLRLSSIGDARLELDDAASSAAESPPALLPQQGRRSRYVPWLIATIAIAVAGVTALWRPDDEVPAANAKVAFEIPLPSEQVGAVVFAISPDGRMLLARLIGPDGIKLWLRPLDSLSGTFVAGVTDAIYPFWSPDSRSIGFFTNDRLRVIDVSGTAPRTLAEVSGLALGGTWGRDGTIIFAPSNNGPLYRVPSAGGTPAQVTELDAANGEVSHRHPVFLPDGVHFVFLAQHANTGASAIRLGSLTSKATTRLVETTGQPLFFPPHWLLFLRESSLVAQQLDVRSGELRGVATEVVPAVLSNAATGTVGARISDTGVLAYRRGVGERRFLSWIDRSGQAGKPVAAPDVYENPQLSPDGKRLAVHRRDPDGDIWIFDLERGGSTRFTHHPAVDNNPVWSPDGKTIAFVSNRDGGVFNVYQKSSGGADQTETLLHKSSYNKRLDDWSADGRYLLYEETDPATHSDLWVLPMDGERLPRRVLSTRFWEDRASFSPDGRWLAYTSDESGNPQVYVQAFPDAGSKWHVSSNVPRASSPRWRADGKELFFDSSGRMMAVDLAGSIAGREFRASVPRQLFRGLMNLSPHSYDLTPAGDRFLVVTLSDMELGPVGAVPITIETQWQPPRPQ